MENGVSAPDGISIRAGSSCTANAPISASDKPHHPMENGVSTLDGISIRAGSSCTANAPISASDKSHQPR